jgi:hypothetical protein
MKTFNCVCGELIFFENVACVVCERELGFLPDQLVLSSLDPAGEGVFNASHSKRPSFTKSAKITLKNRSATG